MRRCSGLVAVVAVMLFLICLSSGYFVASAEEEEPRIKIEEFIITGRTVLPEWKLLMEIAGYKGELLSLSDLERVAAKITALYRKNGYITSTAYIPPQAFQDGVVEIRILEGKVGEILVEGERYFRELLILGWMGIRSGEVLKYDRIARGVRRINRQESIDVEAVLVPGKEPGTTDIVLKVSDRFPGHLSVDFSNWGTEYTGEHRYGLSLRHTNLFGRDHAFEARWQISENPDEVYALIGRYSVPIGRRGTRLGVEASRSFTELGELFALLDIAGKAERRGIFVNHPLFDTGISTGEVSLTYDSTEVRNSLFGIEVSGEDVEATRLGFAFSKTDRLGRTLFDIKLHFGSADPEPVFTRRDTDDNFFKYTVALARSLPLPGPFSLLLRASAQHTNDSLPPIEQIQMGGGNTVRGYSEAEYLGDTGYVGTLEITSPAFLIPSFIRIPFTGDRLRDQLQMVYFLDAGRADLKLPLTGEREDVSMSGVGIGLRMLAYKGITLRVEWATALGDEPADRDDSRWHVGFHKTF